MLRAAVSLWRERHRRTAELVETAEAPEAAASMERPYRRALVVSLINPKAILFLISFFVQFVDPGYAYPALSFLVLGTLLQLASFAYLSVLIFGGTRLAAAFHAAQAAVGGGHFGGGRPVPRVRRQALAQQRVERVAGGTVRSVGGFRRT